MLNSFYCRSLNYPVSFFLLILVNSFLQQTALFAQADVDKQIIKGLDYCYHFKWEKAEETFKKIIDKHPTDPKGYHYLSSIYFWFYLSNKDEADYNNFKLYSNLAIDKASEMIDKNNNPALLYLLGSNYNYRTIVFATASDYIDAVWAAKKSESYLSDCLKADSSFNDAYLGLGLYNIAVSNIPSGFRWALNLAGISGEQEKGIEYIKITAEEGHIAKVEAQYYLSQILSEVLMDFGSSAENLKNLVKKYPGNILFNYTLAVQEIKMKNLNEAEKILVKIVKKDFPEFSQIISLSKFLLGDVYFRQNNFEKSKEYYLDFLNSRIDKDYTGIASYRLALSCELIGERGNAEKYFSLSGNGNMDIEDDIFAKRKGNIYSKRTLSETEIQIIKAANLIEYGSYVEAVDTLVTLISEIKTEKLKAEAYLLLSDALFHSKSFDESIDYALNAAKLNSSDEKWIKPYAFYYAARSAKAINKIAAAEKYINDAEDINGYDYQKRLENLLKALTRNL